MSAVIGTATLRRCRAVDQIPGGNGALEKILFFLGGLATAIFTYFGVRTSSRSQEQQKKTESETASAGHFIGLGERLIDEQADWVKELRAEVKSHTDQLQLVRDELWQYKTLCRDLESQVKAQNLTIEDLRNQNQTLQEDNGKLQQINRELRAEIRNGMQHNTAVNELIADETADQARMRKGGT